MVEFALLLPGLGALILGGSLSAVCLWTLQKQLSHYPADRYSFFKKMTKWLLGMVAIYGFLSSIYIVEPTCGYEVLWWESKNFFLLGLFLGSLLRN